MEKLYSEDIQERIIIQMCDNFSKGLLPMEVELGIYYNFVPELLIGDRKPAKEMLKVIKSLPTCWKELGKQEEWVTEWRRMNEKDQ